MANLTIIKKQRLLRNPNPKCHYCGILLDTLNKPKYLPEDAYTLDHLLPRSKFGSLNPNNLKDCCLRCNRKRGSLMNKSIKNKIIGIEKYLKFKPNLHPDFFKYLFNLTPDNNQFLSA